MEIHYRRNLNQSYMIVTSEISYSGYQIHMCRRNRIQNLLSFEAVPADGKVQFRYEITGKRSLDHVLESSDFTLGLFIRVLETLVELCRNIKSYLLDEEGILLEPESIYVANDSKEIAFAYCPGRTESITESFRHLMEYLLSKINHEDEQMVLAGYEAYQKSTEEGFSLAEILKILYQYRQQDAADFVPARISPEFGQQESSCSYQEETDDDGEKENQRKKNSGKEDTEITSLKRRVTKRFLERWKTEAKEKEAKEREEHFQKCMEVVGRIPTFLKNRIGKEKEPCVYTPMDYEEQIAETPTVYLGAEECVEGVLKYDGKGDTEDICLNHFPFLVGSGDKADGIIAKRGVSRMHARITREQENYYIEDLNSMNGTWLNEELLEYRRKEKLNPHDTVRLGREKFTFV